jgi:hypothetical protein
MVIVDRVASLKQDADGRSLKVEELWVLDPARLQAGCLKCSCSCLCLARIPGARSLLHDVIYYEQRQVCPFPPLYDVD